jgi:tetratricopeptide (TPR) repeat protein
MRKIFFIFLFIMVISMCYPLHAQATELTYASDYYVHGNDLLNTRQYEEALQAYQTARSMDERFYNEHYGISYQIGWVLNKLGRYDEALKEFQIAEKHRPEWVLPFAIYYNEGCVLAKLGRNEEALQAFDSALLYQQTNWYVLFNKGCILAKMERYPEAVTAFETSRKAYASWLPLLGSYQETAATYDKARGIPQSIDIPLPAPTDTSSSLSIASDAYGQETSVDLLMRTGKDFVARYQYENALVVFDRVLKIEPGNYQAMDWKGYTLANLGRYDESLKLFDQSITYLDYKVNENWYIDAYGGRAWVLAKQGKYNESIKAYDKLFIVEPDSFRGHHDKAWVLAKLGKYDEAVKEYNRSLDWENQYRREIQSHSILGPLGTYQDVANAYDKAKGTQTSLTESSSAQSLDVVIYQTDFSSDPHWQSSRPRQYYWDQMNKSYYFKSDVNLGYADINVPYNETPFHLEYDITIPHADPGTLVRFGLSQYNTSENSQMIMIGYNSQNVILGEFIVKNLTFNTNVLV